MHTSEPEPKRWIYRSNTTLFTIFNTGDSYNLSVGENLQVIGNYSTPTEAAIALITRSTDNAQWNIKLADMDIPQQFRDWEEVE